MTQRKLIITHNLNENLIESVKEVVPDWEVIIGREPSSWNHHLQSAEIIVGWKKEMSVLFDHEHKLKWLQSWSAGVNSMPLTKLKSNHVVLTSANGVHAYPISETIFALMLSLTRNIHTYVRNQLSKTWNHSGLKLELHGKTLGIIGVGAIGKETAKIAKAFGMTVLGVRNSGQSEPYVDAMYLANELNEVLPQCDYVVVTLPLTDNTRQMFGTSQFQQMKPSTIFINIGRGQIVDEAALIEALENKKIAAAGLDVFEKEPLNENSPLWEMENVIITPHTAGSTEHYATRVIEDIFIPNLRGYLNNQIPFINVVDFKKGY
ncbi:D-2-hydroxyacid dehydrogenase [Mesobacillus maritimus]|uniref:D-2-hydroxyacid dehydrogenase n=1 Tax=Mesobacillus maritimus TaxID=1643336 RepID=UPI00203E0E89|nr:D-2-hydroxyacid dehydrogenase [Mesobacillus maritimus]MCM3587999.1 D-2-hydroxyacid dehydrogenase [Mesobacillus maritimus]MCM3668329.1 D-2-hydroxyacid dehydrogenase [Mesobacillus maritimus]